MQPVSSGGRTRSRSDGARARFESRGTGSVRLRFARDGARLNSGIATYVWVVTNRKAPAGARKPILSALSERDETAAICRDKDGPVGYEINLNR